MIEQVVIADHLGQSQRQGGVRSCGTGSRVDDCFPATNADRGGKGNNRKRDQGKDGGTKTDKDVPLRIDGFFGHVGYPLDGQKKPDGKGNRGKGTTTAVKKGIDGQVLPGKAGCGHSGKDQELGHCQYGDEQLKTGSSLDTGDIERRKK